MFIPIYTLTGVRTCSLGLLERCSNQLGYLAQVGRGALLNKVAKQDLAEEVMLLQSYTEEAMSPGDPVSGESDPGSGNKVSPSIRALKLEQCVPETARRSAVWLELGEQGTEWEVSWERKPGPG